MKSIGRLGILAFFLITILAIIALPGCGNGEETPTPTPAPTIEPTPTVAPTPTPEPTPIVGGTLRIAAYEMESLDPHASTGGFELNYHYQNFDTLVKMNPDMSTSPGLAESWDMPDTNTIIFHLKEGVKFHDGTDFNASAVEWNVERFKDPEVQSPHSGMLAAVDSVEVIDDYTIQFNLNTPDVTIFASLSDRAGMMISPAAGEQYGRGRTDLYDHPIGTGPWMVTEYVHDSHIIMERFPDYWDEGKPYLDRLEFRLIPEAAVVLASLEAGTIDLILPETVAVEDLNRAEQIPGVKVPMGPAAGFSVVILNHNFAPFSDVRVREALAWAWDRDAEIASYGGVGTPELGLLPEISWAYNPEVEDPQYSKYPVDYDKARQLLDEAGYPDGFDVTIKAINTPDYLKRAEILKDQWANVDVNATLDVVDLNAALSSIFSGDFEVLPVNHSGRSDPGVHMSLLNHSNSGYNSANIIPTSQEYDDLLDAASQTSDMDERKELYQEAQLVIMELQPMLLGINAPVFIPVQENVEGVAIYPDRKCRLKEVWLSE